MVTENTEIIINGQYNFVLSAEVAEIIPESRFHSQVQIKYLKTA